MRPHTVLLHPTLRVIVYGLVWQWQREGGVNGQLELVGCVCVCVCVCLRGNTVLFLPITSQAPSDIFWSHGLHTDWLS